MLKKFFTASFYTFSLLFSQSIALEHLNDFEQFIEEARTTWQVPGAAISIVQGDQVIFSKGIGKIRFDQPEQVDAETLFSLASVSKTFTAAGLAIAVDKNLLGWDQEVLFHFPQFCLKDIYATRYATPRDLLAHRTGLPAFGGDLLGKIGYNTAEILARVRHITPATSFRNKALYSNIGFFIAGQLSAYVQKSTWEETILRTLLQPLQMKRSGFVSDMHRQTNVAFAHAIINGQMKVIPWDDSMGIAPAGGVISTANDMANWMVFHLNQGRFNGKQILKPETVEELFSPVAVTEVSFAEAPPINKHSDFSFSLGWDTYNYNGYTIVEKAGALDGTRTIVTLIPELKLGITVLCNLNLTLYPEAVRAKFLDMYVSKSKEDLQAAILAKKNPLATIIEPEAKPKDAAPLGHALSQYTGTFENELYGTFVVVEKENGLRIEAGPAKWEGKLTHWGNDTFLLSWPNINSGYSQITFTFGPNDKATQMQSESFGLFSRKEAKP